MNASAVDPSGTQAADLAATIGARLSGSTLRVAVVEYLTGGHLCTRLTAAPDAAAWFAGGVVAARTETLQRLLDITPEPVVSARAAEEMAAEIARHTAANLTLAVTGVASTDDKDRQEVGTVFIAIRSPHGDIHVAERMLGGSPEEIVDSAVVASLRLLDARVNALGALHSARR